MDTNNPQAVADFNNTYVPLAKLKEVVQDKEITRCQQSLDEATAGLRKFESNSQP